jgi:transcriptional regulator with XRE-family HTH domain
MKTRPDLVRLGTLVKKGRLNLRLTMVALGRKAKGLSKGYLSGIEQGKVAPPAFHMAWALASGLQILPEEFAILCQILKLPAAALKRARIVEEIDALFVACGEKTEKAAAPKE